MAKGNGHRVPPTPAAPPIREVQLSPLILELQGCNFVTQKMPDGNTAVHFIHQSGVLACKAVLNPDAVRELVRQLTGGVEVAAPGHIPDLLQ